MDMQDQLKKLFPAQAKQVIVEKKSNGLWIPFDPVLCKYEKRNGKPLTIIDGYDGSDKDGKELSRLLKKKLGVGGNFKKGQILIQGDYRDKIIKALQELGFKTKRVGG